MDKGIIVIKIGTATLTDQYGRLDVGQIASLTAQVSSLFGAGYKVVIVTSGAIGTGLQALRLSHRPKELAKLQAAAAIGQGRLMRLYEENFSRHGISSAQLLLTQDDFNDRKRFLNAKQTISTLLNDFKAVPIINENDTVATEEIKFGDNDKLSALVTALLNAHTLVILTDVDGLYSPEDKKIIPLVSNISHETEKMAQPSKGRLGTGGMISKIKAARITVESGATCVIANGRLADVLIKIIEKKESIGTTFLPAGIKAKAKKRWLAFSPKPKGKVFVDDGARKAVVSGNKSLLASGVYSVSGDFKSGDVISIATLNGEEFAKGVVNFSSKELNIIKGLKTNQIEQLLRHKVSHDEVIHRDNLVVSEFE